MVIMYVDDSGSVSYSDHTNYFVLSGVIVHDDQIKDMQRAVFDYKQSNFTDIGFIDSEIHTHDIYISKDDFEHINLARKTNLLDNLYGMISSIDCVAISVVIDKSGLKATHPTWKVLNTAWSFLIERYNMFLEENSIGSGLIKMDKSSAKVQKETARIVRDLVYDGTDYQTIDHVSHFKFVDSCVAGIQVADAFAYCTFLHSMNNGYFDRFWKVIYDKFRKNPRGEVLGYGYKKFPK